MIADIKKADSLISDVTLLDSYQDTRTFHITYQSKTGNLTAEDIKPIREKILKMLSKKYQASLKGV
jgi:phenylalanyl-tRNA synthetase beta subunit